MMADHHDPNFWTWAADKVLAFGAGIIVALYSAWRWLEGRLGALSAHDAAIDGKLAEHDKRIAVAASQNRSLEERLQRIEESAEETRELAARIAGKLGV